MSSTRHSFIDIFETLSIDSKETMPLKIVIPPIQRDYAQGRIDDTINKVRSRFLSALHDAIINEPITLDFVYGNIDKDGVLTPLDGQQRLTTLFLLHWYAAQKEHISEEKYAFLNNFSYKTRYSARYFCKELISFTPSFQEKISQEIVNQSWFPLDWEKDPTISSMLVMIDAIDEQFKDVPNIWESLENHAITFYFLPIKDMELTDELYIKMNSRGKPLTLFEHFKAELERELRVLDEKNSSQLAKNIIGNIDKKWTDLLWNYRNGNFGDADDNIIDDEFLRYFKFICDVICYRNGNSPQGYSNDIFDLIHLYFSAKNDDTVENINTLEAFFNCWCDIKGFNSPSNFLKSFMSHTHEPGKIIVDSKNNLDIFEDCLHSYSDKSGKLRHFPLNRIVLLYAITVYLQHQTDVSYEEFVRRIRIINNLIQNSEDEVSDRLDRNRIPAILQAIDTIMLTGMLADDIDNNFNAHQIQEEKEKIEFLMQNPNRAEDLFILEDHDLLKGQISILGLENFDYSNRFISLFAECSRDKIDCALMTMGKYYQQERTRSKINIHYQYGSSSDYSFAWNNLFHKSANGGFDNTKDILVNLLKTHNKFSDTILDNMISDYIAKCEADKVFPWNYYYVKYLACRPGSYGKMSNPDAKTNPYLFSVMQTKSVWSQNTYIPYLKEADAFNLSKESCGQRLVYNNTYITCGNNVYYRCKNDDDSIIETIEIEQNSDGIDIEDRIIKLKNYLATHQDTL